MHDNVYLEVYVHMIAHISTRWYDDVARLDEIQFSSYDIEMMNDAESLD